MALSDALNGSGQTSKTSADHKDVNSRVGVVTNRRKRHAGDGVLGRAGWRGILGNSHFGGE